MFIKYARYLPRYGFLTLKNWNRSCLTIFFLHRNLYKQIERLISVQIWLRYSYYCPSLEIVGENWCQQSKISWNWKRWFPHSNMKCWNQFSIIMNNAYKIIQFLAKKVLLPSLSEHMWVSVYVHLCVMLH